MNLPSFLSPVSSCPECGPNNVIRYYQPLYYSSTVVPACSTYGLQKLNAAMALARNDLAGSVAVLPGTVRSAGG